MLTCNARTLAQCHNSVKGQSGRCKREVLVLHWPRTASSARRREPLPPLTNNSRRGRSENRWCVFPPTSFLALPRNSRSLIRSIIYLYIYSATISSYFSFPPPLCLFHLSQTPLLHLRARCHLLMQGALNIIMSMMAAVITTETIMYMRGKEPAHRCNAVEE
ncbi:unnamed protein product [Trypanosoma congolense IL3000]|uniref:WGS project CAEQ00000000 data, annotated contig 1313 n=1 Tax=Trypanosoma congolense (strain IL3000) TaxID=1068625 RepID=F9W5D1_TRYCI|nr:unnamed protein product [Trypanosoma congolense IL3000]